MSVSLSSKAALAPWLESMRLPFTSVALVPFAVGAYWAFHRGLMRSWLIAALGLAAVFLLCIGCYLLGEVYDQAEDLQTLRYGRSPFTGGALWVAQGILPARSVARLAWISFALAAVLGLIISRFHASLLLFGLGAFGALTAAFYSFPPVRLVKRGVGEFFIGVCYGWLTLVTGYVCAAGSLPPLSYAFCLPIALTVFNIILINEFPDFEADRDARKLNLMQRVGQVWVARIYAAAALLSALALLGLWHFSPAASWRHLLILLPAMFLALWLAFQVLVRARWRDRQALKTACALSILLNHICSLSIGALLTWQ